MNRRSLLQYFLGLLVSGGALSLFGDREVEGAARTPLSRLKNRRKRRKRRHHRKKKPGAPKKN